jgi:hypothetical protein
MTGSRRILTLHRADPDAQRLKVTLVLDATSCALSRHLTASRAWSCGIRLPDRKLTADIAAKSLRKAQAAIRDAGADAVALVLLGCLVEGDVIAEAGSRTAQG